MLAKCEYDNDLDDIPPQHQTHDSQSANSYIRRSILQRLLEYAQDGIDPVSAPKKNESYYSEIFSICGENATCIDQLIQTVVKSGGDAENNLGKYDLFVSQMITDFKDWLKTDHTENARRPRKKTKIRRKRVRFQDTNEKKEKEIPEEPVFSQKREVKQTAHKKSQLTLWVMGAILFVFGFLLRRFFQQALDGQSSALAHVLQLKPFRIMREYLLV